MSTHHCMLAHKYDPARITNWPVIIEPKLDGVRVLAHADAEKNEVHFTSRAGKPFTSFAHLSESILDALNSVGRPRMTFDGEMVSGTFRDSVSQARRKETPALDAVYHVFDLFYPPSLGPRMPYLPLFQRRVTLERTGLKLTPQFRAHSPEQIQDFYCQFRGAGYEGAIVKDPLGAYELKRSFAWMKIKAEESVDVPITGTFEGTGKYRGMLGGLLVSHQGVEVGVGTGLTDAQRRDFWHLRDELPGRIVEVGYHEITPDGSLRHPRFVRFRDVLSHGVKE